ncbi:hypothetical protein BDF19DRAFT_452610, partial [Syncephalis fuscata]
MVALRSITKCLIYLLCCCADANSSIVGYSNRHKHQGCLKIKDIRNSHVIYVLFYSSYYYKLSVWDWRAHYVDL